MKLSYEICKQLKDSGLPQKGDFYFRDGPDGLVEFFNGVTHKDGKTQIVELRETDVLSPTLSELIEWCGDRFAGIIKGPIHPEDNDMVHTYKAFENIWMITKEPARDFRAFLKGKITHGSTLEEAVALLGLEIHKK